MERPGRRVAFCLALGALTTLVVAWVLAIRVVVTVPGGPWVTRQGLYGAAAAEEAWWCQVLERPGLTVVVWEPGRMIATVAPQTSVFQSRSGSRGALRLAPSAVEDQAVPRWGRRLEVDALADVANPLDFYACSARGWPLRTVWYDARFGGGARVNSGGIGVPKALSALGPGRFLPCRPIVLGLVGNTVFYGALWLALIALPGALRRARWVRAGRCPDCGYDLRGGRHDRCPECGTTRSVVDG